eukprot:Tamp_20505.p2 GENE.Tamp_20505~~Tamp_20505.p2  ORF type:complete len:223 (-),score=68.22 Tamp_20505:526-1194(-)
MHKRTHTDVAEDMPAEARQRRRLQESDARQLRSKERALAAREQRVADAQRAQAVSEQELLEREQRVADALRALAATEQRLADAQRALAARERNANAQAALERVRLWLPALPRSDAGAPGGGAADGNAWLAVARHEKTKSKITVNIKKPGTETMCFLTSKHRTLEKLMCTYCEIQHLDVSNTKFFLELKSTDTGDGPRLVNGCVLHALPPNTVPAKSGSGESP